MADSTERTFAEPNEEIMRATHRALRNYGYADLTIKRIAEEYGKSTAAVHYYYETKDDLLVAFLDYLLGQFVDSIEDVETADPERRLELLLDELLVEPGENQDLLVAVLEMRSQTPFEEAFRERFHRNDEYIRDMLEAVIDRGIDEGVFDDVDADHVSRVLMTIVDGSHSRAVVQGETDPLSAGRRAADEFTTAVLLDDQ
ncbi:TetR/AcrR family transcriptional regulator [Haloarchaeobius sp. HRN-SO-5]|uniref:TetR/AcrR family transcriptional regulator n=1 Tax=Haloarchaeobius sp. HRN-SO-5 TaxID=3446118 RepID=UPI003EBDA29A